MTLYEQIRTYLEERGWYWDEEHFINVWDRPSTDDDKLRYHCWTMPQWKEYWNKPYWDDPTHENFGSQPTRRYESFQEALWSQVCREVWPEDFEMFFQIGKEQ